MTGAYERYYDEAYDQRTGARYDASANPDEDGARYGSLREETIAWLERTGVAANRDARVLELGCGLGQLRNVHPGWIGLEFSGSAVERVRQSEPGARVIHGDMRSIPEADRSVDAIFSWAAIEHVPGPEHVMTEIERVLAPGGVAILAPAWNCRPWTVKRLQVRQYRDLGARDRIEKLAIPLREHVVWRAAAALPRRIAREVRGTLLRREIPFDYLPLQPDLSLDVPHITDDDAQASMDAHAAIAYFASRGWSVLSHPGFVARMKARAEPVVVRKPQ